VDSCLEEKKKGARKHERKKKEENQQERRKNIVKSSPNLVRFETPFLFSLRPRSGNEEENPKKIDLRPKLAEKETEIN
jgi:hypothetical protein